MQDLNDKKTPDAKQTRAILIYDDSCKLCTVLSDFGKEKTGIIEPIGSGSGELVELIKKNKLDTEKHVYLMLDNEILKGEEVFMEVLKLMRGPYKLLYFMLSLVPNIIHKKIYHLISKYRFTISEFM